MGKRPSPGWPAWRITMLAGALVLLALALARALTDGTVPPWVEYSVTIGGYVALAVGFGLAMRARSADKKREPDKLDT